MKILPVALLCLCLCSAAFADQRTTVLTETAEVGKAAAQLPYIDGSNDAQLEKQANSLLRSTAAKLAGEVGGGSVSYTVTLNRPSLVSFLLEAENGGRRAYQAVNVDLTTGREFTVGDFFVADDTVKNTFGGEEKDVLFTEYGVRLRDGGDGPYDRLVPYSQVIGSMRIGEAGRIMQIARLTQNAGGRTLTVKSGSLIALKLDSNPSTGFRWEAVLPEGVSKVGSSFTMPQSDDQRTGTPGVEIVVLAAKNPGTYKISMEYKRPWERLVTGRVTFNLIVE